jgi:hypothetical protein
MRPHHHVKGKEEEDEAKSRVDQARAFLLYPPTTTKQKSRAILSIASYPKFIIWH